MKYKTTVWLRGGRTIVIENTKLIQPFGDVTIYYGENLEGVWRFKSEDDINAIVLEEENV